MIKLIIIAILFVGMLLVSISIANSYNACPAPSVVYKFIPRSFAENQDNPVPLDDILGKMFTEPSPWVAQFNSNYKLKGIREATDVVR